MHGRTSRRSSLPRGPVPSSAGQGPAVHTLNLQGNGETQSRRAMMRAASTYAEQNDLGLNHAEIRILVSGYHSSADRDSVSLSRWLEVRCSNPTMATALVRVCATEARLAAERAAAEVDQ